MTERKQLEEAIAALEVQRGILGDAVVETALAPLRERLAALDAEPETGVHTAIQPAASRAGERRVVTILFCDVKGSTAMAEQLDPEEWAGIIQRALEYVTEPVRRHGGTVAEVRGDGILAFFGAPVAHEDDPQRSVIAGLEILESIQFFHEQIKRARGLDFNVRVGIHTGLVVVRDIGSEEQVEYTAIGDAVNLAARMEQTARPGTLQISDQTYRLVEQIFDVEPLGEVKVKGKRAPVRAYRVIGLKAQPGPLRGLERHGLHSPLVGREVELAELKECLDRLVDGQGSIVGIFGEAGIGKSRLIAEVQASAGNLLWLEGHTLSFGQTISYWPFQQILRDWSGIAEDDSESEAWTKLEMKVQALFGEETIDYLPYLASLLALQVRGDYAERVKYLDGEALGKQIFLTARRFFERLASGQPVVLVFEDLHWMDESSTNLLEHLLPLVERVRILILGLSRPEERHTPAARLRERCAHDYADRYSEIQLAPLSGADSTQLVHNLLEIEDLPAHLREMIVAKAEGNPFFLEEVIRTLIGTGMLRRDPASGRLQAIAPIESLHIPDTIQGVILARVDRLDEEVKRVLRVAAVIGRSFLYRVLMAIAESGRRLDDSLAELQQTEFIREKRVMPELEYIFNHALAQEATYESILLQKRRELHARVGQAIEALFAGRLEEFYGLLAYHYARAEAWEKAQDYLLKAGDQAGRISADAEALNYYQHAMAAYTRAFGNRWDPLQRASLERKMGEAFVRRGEFPQAIDHFQRALGHLGYRLPVSPWEVRWALARELAVQIGQRLQNLFLKPITEAARPGAEDEAYIYYYTAAIDALSNSERYLLLALRMLNFSERRGYPLGVVIGSVLAGVALDLLALFGLARWFHRHAVEVAHNLSQPFALGGAYYGLQLHVIYLGELDLSLEYGRRSAKAFHDAGDLLSWGLSTALMSWISAFLSDFDEAQAFSQELLHFGQDAGARSVWCWGEGTQGHVLRRQGNLQQAIAHQQKSIELAEAIPDYLYRIFAGSELGLCYLRQGDWQAALAELKMCQRFAAEHHVIEPSGRVFTLNNLTETYLFAAEHSAPPERAAWLNKAKGACRAGLKESPKFRAKWPKALRLRGTYEWLGGKPAAAHNWWQKSLAEAERMGLRYDVAMTHLEIGQRLGNPIHLEKAESIFAEIGSVTIESTSLPASIPS